MSDTPTLLPTREELARHKTAQKWRPQDGPDVLRQLAMDRGLSVCLELKPVSATQRYWLCTEGCESRRPDVPEGWVVGAITPEVLTDGEWRAGMVYSAETRPHLATYQALEKLGAELEQLKQQAVQAPESDAPARLERVRAEVMELTRSLQTGEAGAS
jgi:hypothetical protein